MTVTTMNISLPAELARFVRDKVESGHYSSVSEVVREALRCLAGRENGTNPAQRLRTLAGAPFDRSLADEAVRRIRELQQRQTLGQDLSIEELINEGRDA
jgi:antitoxin ParD1/3/4